MTFVPATEKRCTSCGQIKSLDDFPWQNRGLFNRSSHCKSCKNEARRKLRQRSLERHAAYMRQYRMKHRDDDISRKMKSAYGITLAQYRDMFSAQGGKCAICSKTHISDRRWKTTERLHIDHCHETKRVRGLLCSNCNIGIGCLKHDVTILRRAIDYLSAD